MTHPIHENETYFQRELAPIMGKRLQNIQVTEDGYPYLIFEGINKNSIFVLWILSDAEGNSGGWPDLENKRL